MRGNGGKRGRGREESRQPSRRFPGDDDAIRRLEDGSGGLWRASGVSTPYQADLGAVNSKGERRAHLSPCALAASPPSQVALPGGEACCLGAYEGLTLSLSSPPSRVSPAGCDMCADNRNGECPMHGPLHSLRRLVGTSSAAAAAPPPELPEWLRDLPREVCLCTSTVPGLAYGICAAQRIQQGTWIGPFQGVLLPPEKVQAGAVRNTQHLWEVSRLATQDLATRQSLGPYRASLVPQRAVETRFLWSCKYLVFAAPAEKEVPIAAHPGSSPGLQVSEDGITLTNFQSAAIDLTRCLP